MIKYDKFWITLEKRGMTQYTLIKDYQISKSLLYRLRHNEGINMNTIDTLCSILKCNIEDIATHYEEIPLELPPCDAAGSEPDA